MNYVGLSAEEEAYTVVNSNRMTLGGTRDRDALVAFQDAVKTLLNEFRPDYLAIKEKPETGKMRGGAAALKMEGIVIANAPCQVEFISGRRINQVLDDDANLYGYLKPAFKAAVASLRSKSG